MGVAAAATLDYDAELMLRVKEGDGTSFGVLLEKHRASVIHFVYRLVQEQAVAEELAQEVFLRVYRSRSSYAPTAKFKTWLFRIATHLASRRKACAGAGAFGRWAGGPPCPADFRSAAFGGTGNGA